MFTKKQLIDLFRERNFRAKKSFGQNFLIDKNIVNKLIEVIDIKSTDNVLEIGPGCGEMTEFLVKAKTVTAVEKDRDLARLLREDIFAENKNIEIVQKDILEFDLKKKYDKVIGNLPYYITTPIIEKMIFDQKCKELFLMVQKEYAQRLIAKPGTKAYSSLTCFVGFYATVEKIAIVPKDCFFPEPKVDSMFIKICRTKYPRVKVKDEGLFFRIIRTCFQHRRKTIRASLKKFVFKENNSNVEEVLEQIGIQPNVRPEQLDIEDFGKLADEFLKRR